jgi:hypothetical protein
LVWKVVGKQGVQVVVLHHLLAHFLKKSTHRAADRAGKLTKEADKCDENARRGARHGAAGHGARAAPGGRLLPLLPLPLFHDAPHAALLLLALRLQQLLAVPDRLWLGFR